MSLFRYLSNFEHSFQEIRYWACVFGHFETIKEIIFAGDKENIDIIFSTLCEYGHLEIIKYIVNEFPQIQKTFEKINEELEQEDINNIINEGFQISIVNNHYNIFEELLNKTVVNQNHNNKVWWHLFFNKRSEMIKIILKDNRYNLSSFIKKHPRFIDDDYFLKVIKEYNSKRFLLHFNEEIEYLITN